MRWCSEEISEAVAISKRNEAIFVVFVEGKESVSEGLKKLLDDPQVLEILESRHFVAIKIELDSLSHRQFSQIYTQATLPSIFFIGKTGTPLEIIAEVFTPHEFVEKLYVILQKHGVNRSSVLVTTDSATTQPEGISSQANIVSANEDSASELKDTLPKSSSSQDSVSQAEKLERAKEILAQKREAKRSEEEENERKKEIERRKVGQDVQELKRWQQENELKELMEERNKEKKAEQDAKKRVLAQIAQDKIERAAKFATPSPNKPDSPQSTSKVTHRVVNSNFARLQFKLPDGSTHTHEFPSNDTLKEVRNFILSNLSLPFANFTMSTTFPRRELSGECISKTLLDLELVPNAVILILPLHNGTVATNSDSWVVSFFWSFLGPLLGIYNYLKGKLFGNTPPKSSNNQPTKRPNASGEPSNQAKRRMPESTYVSKQGNVHRLTDKNDSDEDNNTWNGNSTQQM